MTDYICKQCGSASPVGVGYAASNNGASLGRVSCDCGQSVLAAYEGVTVRAYIYKVTHQGGEFYDILTSGCESDAAEKAQTVASEYSEHARGDIVAPVLSTPLQLLAVLKGEG